MFLSCFMFAIVLLMIEGFDQIYIHILKGTYHIHFHVIMNENEIRVCNLTAKVLIQHQCPKF